MQSELRKCLLGTILVHITVVVLQEENEVMKNHWYKLVVEKISLPDPCSLVNGWCVAPSHLPNTLYNDVQDYLMKYDPEKSFQ